MDCNMPIMNGFQASEIIKNMVDSKFIPYVPILAVTANASIKEIEHCKKFFMEHYLAKPVQKIIMKEKIEEILKLKL